MPDTILSLQNRLNNQKKRTAYAWHRYYVAVRDDLHDDHDNYDRIERITTDDAIPTHIKTELTEMAKLLKKKWECPICLDFIPNDKLDITNCGHFYCEPCLTGWKNTQKDNGEDKWKCGVCNRKHNFKPDDE